MKLELLQELLNARTEGKACVLATELTTGEQALLIQGRTIGDLVVDADCAAEAQRLLNLDHCGIYEGGSSPIFLHVYNPPPRLIIVGAVHIAEPLTRMAASAGYRVLIVDPRRAFANRDRFRSVEVIAEWPDVALERLQLGPRCAVVTLTHDPKLDDAALRVALASPAFYIGCLGSRKTHSSRLNRLQAQGFSQADLARIHGPVGLAIGALSPAEIAVSILAEITQVRRGTEDA